MSKTKSTENLQSSTNCLRHKDLTSEDICSIIKSCGANGVKSFAYDGLKIVFSSDLQESEQQLLINTIKETPITDGFIDENSFVEEDEEEAKKIQLEQMAILNPDEYEQAILSGELINESMEESDA